MRFAFYTSNSGKRVFKALSKNKKFRDDIKIIISDDKKTEYLAQNEEIGNIPYILIDWEYLKGTKTEKRKYLSDYILTILREYDIDYMFCNGSHILSGELLEEYKNKIINFHGAILPSYKGRMQLDKMIDNKEFLLGTTAHFIDSGMDTGPIIMEAVIPSKAYDQNGYDVVLDTQLDLMFSVHALLKESRIKVIEDRVEIIGADYSHYNIFPHF